MKVLEGKDITTVRNGYIVQQCNCNTRRGKGLAGVLEDKFSYCNVYRYRRYGEKSTPGTYELYVPLTEQDADQGLPKIVCLMGQWAPGKPLDYMHLYGTPPNGEHDTAEQRLVWFRKALTQFLVFLQAKEVDLSRANICVPYQIGCGLAGGDWNRYSQILTELEQQFKMEFNVYKLEK